jgi:hypothetical protein
LQAFSKAKAMKYQYLEDEWTKGYLNFIKNNLDKNFDLDYLINNPNITSEIKENNPEIFKNIENDYIDDKFIYNKICHSDLTWEDIQNSNEPISGYYASKNPNITWDIIINNLNYPWYWDILTYHPNITWNIIKKNPYMKWVLSKFSSNPNLTWKIVQDNPNINWNWQCISINSMEKGKEQWIKDLRLQIIKANQIQRYWRNCSCNPVYKLAQKLLTKIFVD